MQHDASYPWEEPGAGNLHARICEGESRMAELLDQFPTFFHCHHQDHMDEGFADLITYV